MSSARVTLYGKPGCHLCDDARAVIERVCADLGETYEEISILDDPALMERYGEEIPVTLVDGRRHDFWRVSEERPAPVRTLNPRVPVWLEEIMTRLHAKDPARRPASAGEVSRLLGWHLEGMARGRKSRRDRRGRRAGVGGWGGRQG